MKKKIFIGAAWPYANNSLHLGHVSGLLGADILARYHRLKGDDVLFVSGSDCHGTPIVVEAEKEKISPEEIAKKYTQEFIDTLIAGLGFSYDIFTTTLTKKHERTVQDIFLKLHEKGFIYTKKEELPYCPKCERFLPDRYIEGVCPTCGYKNARGDQCDECGNLLDPHQLNNPKCKICSSSPTWKESEHFFLKLSVFQEKLEKWIKESNSWRANAKNFSLKLLEQGLKDRAITRDIDWGVPIPIKGYEDKKIYVWFDAVCGYLSASYEWADKKSEGNAWQEFWQNDESLHYYVHGKDNIPFHTVIWPAMLIGYGGLRLPDAIVSSEYLTLEKKQFSKSRNWAVWLPEFLKNFDGDTLRYYLTANGPETSDADFSWREYAARTNKELIGNFGNFVHRTLTLAQTHFPEGIEPPDKISENKLVKQGREKYEKVGQLIEKTRFREALKEILELAESGNRFLAGATPWQKIKSNKNETADDLWVALYLIHNLAILAEPYLPKTSQKIYDLLDVDRGEKWQAPKALTYKIKNPKPLFKQIEDEEVERETNKLGSRENG